MGTKIRLHGEAGNPIVNKAGQTVMDHHHQKLHLGDEVAIISGVGSYASVHIAIITKQTPAMIQTQTKFPGGVMLGPTIAKNRPSRILRLRLYDEVDLE